MSRRTDCGGNAVGTAGSCRLYARGKRLISASVHTSNARSPWQSGHPKPWT
jgi:hypothetical protein